MDIPAHILDAVSALPPSSAEDRIRSIGGGTRKSRSNLRAPRPLRTTASSVEDISSLSDYDPEQGYLTDPTTPASSDSSPEDMQSPDDVDDFRDREYPQLKDQTYLDHGGTTVGKSLASVVPARPPLTLIPALCQVPCRGLLT